MGCKQSQPKNNKKLISSLRTVSMHAEDMLAREIQRETIEGKKKRARAKLKLLYHLKKNKNYK